MTTALPDPEQAHHLTDARLQLHHAAQLATALGISYLAPRPDDSHTSLEWRSELDALVSRAAPEARDTRIGIRATDLTLLFLDAAFVRVAALPLSGETIESAASWLRSQLAARGADASRFTLSKHYTIPPHALDSGAPFDTGDASAFAQLAAWLASASEALTRARAVHSNASEIRCWPHHFDLAFLIEPRPGTSVGVGLEPGDVSYDEPYYYVNMYPAPNASDLTETIEGGGFWHTREWIGAVLPGSHLSGRPDQAHQVDAFLRSAIAAAIGHVTRSSTAVR